MDVDRTFATRIIRITTIMSPYDFLEQLTFKGNRNTFIGHGEGMNGWGGKVTLFLCPSERGLLFKERICSQREQILFSKRY